MPRPNVYSHSLCPNGMQRCGVLYNRANTLGWLFYPAAAISLPRCGCLDPIRRSADTPQRVKFLLQRYGISAQR